MSAGRQVLDWTARSGVFRLHASHIGGFQKNFSFFVALLVLTALRNLDLFFLLVLVSGRPLLLCPGVAQGVQVLDSLEDDAFHWDFLE